MNPHASANTNTDACSFARYRFPPEVIVLAARWYLRYGLSYRDVEELLAERVGAGNSVRVNDLDVPGKRITADDGLSHPRSTHHATIPDPSAQPRFHWPPA